jgi:hypothetical protein
MYIPTCSKLGNLYPRYSSIRASPKKNSQYLPKPGYLIRNIGAISGYIRYILPIVSCIYITPFIIINIIYFEVFI